MRFRAMPENETVRASLLVFFCLYDEQGRRLPVFLIPKISLGAQR